MWMRVYFEHLCRENYVELPSEDKRVTQHGTTAIDLNDSWEEYKERMSNEKV